MAMNLHHICESCLETEWSGRTNGLTGGWLCSRCDEDAADEVDATGDEAAP
jgi:ribosomal protein L37AE/L43A